MGATPVTSTSSPPIPKSGGRITQIHSPELEKQLQIFTDFIVHPSLHSLSSINTPSIEITIFSILDYSVRKETLAVKNNHIGVTIKPIEIKDNILRITKVFSGSPCEQLGIAVGEYIVGMGEGEYNSLNDFAQTLKKLIQKQAQTISLVVCSQIGKTRLVAIPIVVLKEWKKMNKGLLGCELAEGWMNKFKLKPKKMQKSVPACSEAEPAPVSAGSNQFNSKDQIISGISELKKIVSADSSELEECEDQCNRLNGYDRDVIEVKFKGLYKNEYLDDASTICRCKVYNKHCERCYVRKGGQYYFFNKKTNQIIGIPEQLMFNISPA